ncbi:hypothetical protein Hypma_003357 [Hypsizygus marmoreus]|uniref:Uncharacterized protein n=1 Tax=Hypsizygus marmoreus TaxID=39966 RepID=A0A369JB96_HYPMA|nr:hypothetical protein Hypma_003357 [Hypsizygus marmoreus]
MTRGSNGLINYGHRGENSSDSAPTSPATPVTPTPQGRKRPRVEFESDSIESIPSTEKNTN